MPLPSSHPFRTTWQELVYPKNPIPGNHKKGAVYCILCVDAPASTLVKSLNHHPNSWTMPGSNNGDSEHIFSSNTMYIWPWPLGSIPLPPIPPTYWLTICWSPGSTSTNRPHLTGIGTLYRDLCCTARLALLPSGVVIINCYYSVLSTIPEA